MKKFLNTPICVDFDGTIVEHDYPRIGKPVPYAVETIKKLQSMGANIVLFTMRSDGPLDEAVQYCKENGIVLYGINRNPSQTWTNSPKAYGNYYIDDAAIGCPLIYIKGQRPYVDWLKVYQIINARQEME
jgi:hydroxymethylpyrimidine pyrophosphatase-like HAD family hydrolase